MTTFMSRDVLEGLANAGKHKAKHTQRLRVQMGESIFPILRMTDSSFTLDTADKPKLRGYVDILDGTRLKYRALIVASETEPRETVFEFKQATNVATGPALDFEQSEDAPIGYLEHL
jgi:hypothetical protein